MNKERKEGKGLGFISLHRAVRFHWIWQDPVKFQWWVDILMECNHADQKVNFGFELLECKRGQSLNSLVTWSKRWRVEVGVVRRFLDLLKKDKMVETESVIKTTRLTVCNYDDYNNPRQANDRQTTGKRIPSEFGALTNNNDSNNDKEISAANAAPQTTVTSFKKMTREEFQASLKAFVEKYGREMVAQFAVYWREPDEKGKMRFQQQRTWDNAGRLATWKRRADDQQQGVKPKSAQTAVADAILDKASTEIIDNIKPKKNGYKGSEQVQVAAEVSN